MTGRGIDQVLPHPGSPELHEPFVHDAGQYVELAEQAHGPIAKPVSYSYVWGQALDEWTRRDPDVRIVNLETSVTHSSDYWREKEVHYRMHPSNVGCLTAAAIDGCSLANNHVLDWGYGGLAETLQTLRAAGVKTAGAGANLQEAQVPAVFDVPGTGRLMLFSFGSETSGIPCSWAATNDRAGVALLDDLSAADVQRVRSAVQSVKSANDVVVASIHWGPNWGYHVPGAQRHFAHALIDGAGVDLVYGHSSHHVKGIEVYRGRLILYGCGDFLDDYEGIAAYEAFRSDLGLIYFAAMEARTGKLVQLQMTPTQIHRLSVRRADAADMLWLRDTLNREGETLGTRVELAADNTLVLRWGEAPWAPIAPLASPTTAG
jgi:poly-gamma-glutamate synthesis protein (capsule biosynthesis protein)